ncbi:MAG: hypothetical protein QM500_01730 [Methylococcales bacterium]
MIKHHSLSFALVIVVLFQASLLTASSSAIAQQSPDHSQDSRSFQHGIDILKLSNDRYVLIWASSGNPPSGEDSEGEWTHDVYYSFINPLFPQIKPVRIIAAPGAQEPASSAISKDAHIMVTMEDAYQAENGLAQTYAIFDSSMKPVKKYQNMVFDGGHSGHVAAVNNHFVVFYSEGWIDGGGVDKLGSGNDILLSLYDSKGHFLVQKNVSVGDHTRDWWPLIAGSDSHALLLWQRFVDNTDSAKLMYRVFNPVTQGWVNGTTELANGLKYYHYTVQYISSLDLFFVCGTYKNNTGFVFLISNDGTVIAQNTLLPPLVREAKPAISLLENGKVKIVYPSSPDRLAMLSISHSGIQLNKTMAVDFHWSYSGTTGIFLNNRTVYFASLSADGIKQLMVNIN